jgi:hypothetical protein
LNFFGGVPLYDETLIVDKDFNNMMEPRATLEATRNFILADLDAAITSLPVKWDNSNYGRATKGAAYALKGKVLLFDKQYAAAAANFEEIVNDPTGKGYGYALYASYEDLFKPTGDQSSEMIFAIQNSGGVGLDYGMPMTFYMAVRDNPASPKLQQLSGRDIHKHTRFLVINPVIHTTDASSACFTHFLFNGFQSLIHFHECFSFDTYKLHKLHFYHL